MKVLGFVVHVPKESTVTKKQDIIITFRGNRILCQRYIITFSGNRMLCLMHSTETGCDVIEDRTANFLSIFLNSALACIMQ